MRNKVADKRSGLLGVVIIGSFLLGHTVSQASEGGDLVEQLKKKYASVVTQEAVSSEQKLYQDAGNYAEGTDGFRKDLVEARKLYLMAAEAGYPKAQLFVGGAYYNGKYGFPKDEKTAVAWFQKAANAGNSMAQVRLFHCYNLGKGGVKKDRKRAQYWHDKVVESDTTGAALNILARLYLNGNNITKLSLLTSALPLFSNE